MERVFGKQRKANHAGKRNHLIYNDCNLYFVESWNNNKEYTYDVEDDIIIVYENGRELEVLEVEIPNHCSDSVRKGIIEETVHSFLDSIGA